jgi:hypothetical protein
MSRSKQYTRASNTGTTPEDSRPSTWRVDQCDDDGDVFVVHEGTQALVEIRGGAGLDLAEDSRDAMLATVAGFSKQLMPIASGEVETSCLPLVGAASAKTVNLLIRALRDNADLRTQFDPQRIEPVRQAFADVFGLLMQNTYHADISNLELAEQAQAAADVFHVLLTGNTRQLDSVISALEPVTDGDPEQIDVEEAASRARLRLHALYRKVLGESMTVAQLKSWGLSRQRLQQLRVLDRLFAIKIPYQRGLVYPSWQFGINREPRRIMPELLKAARHARLDAVGFHQLMVGRRSNQPTGVEMLDAGRDDRVLALIRGVDR